ncbi:hypothetical protein FEM41_20335 [Jejubacter calystegiae]|uniref:Alginate export domain-containing protein n=1 Tax=Jejubacter calystegiae TaxID=2579935 RepID=A0A4P8YPW2_9ENTR|nr:alginate export family protein [Jejubacter calystegiae]QCT21834.1 hypothetical protein FEM41_20335 [Jejubacter calystegiae]
MTRYISSACRCSFAISLGINLLFASSGVRAEEKPEAPLLQFHTTLKLETWSLRNKSLRKGEKRENEQKREPLARFRVDVAKKRPLYGVLELELTDKTTRESGKKKQSQTKLDLTQAYIGVNIDALNSDLRMGRWLYRDEREWLFDENMDGVLLHWKKGGWRGDVLGARINYWQRDLLNRSTRNTGNAATIATNLRFKIDDKWLAGGYVVMSKNTHDDGYHQYHYGLRSHNEQSRGLRHWAELGMMEGKNESGRHKGYAIDLGATWVFDHDLRSRITLGYALASQHYRQTGLQSNEATFGGDTKFSIYGNTLAPELANLQVFSAGIGLDITPDSGLDLVYHHYRQTRMDDFGTHDPELKSRYDRRNTHRLGEGVDLIWGVEVTDNLKTELLLGMFLPSKRFRSGSGDDASRSSPAYSVGFEVELKF